MLRPYFHGAGVSIPVMPTALPGLRLPLGRRRLGPGAAVAIFVHAAIVGALLIHGRELARRGPPGGGSRAPSGGVNFFAIPGAAPAAVDVAPPLRLTVSDVATLRRIQVELPPLEPLRTTVSAPLQDYRVVGDGGGGGGAGPGATAGSGAGMGTGTGSEAGYIFPASPRTAILPPPGQVPGSVAGHTLRVKFWVATDGRVTRVEVNPPIADGAYSREFQQRMMAYQFYPAHTRDGQSVAGVVTISVRIGH